MHTYTVYINKNYMYFLKKLTAVKHLLQVSLRGQMNVFLKFPSENTQLFSPQVSEAACS